MEFQHKAGIVVLALIAVILTYILVASFTDAKTELANLDGCYHGCKLAPFPKFNMSEDAKIDLRIEMFTQCAVKCNQAYGDDCDNVTNQCRRIAQNEAVTGAR